MHARKDRRFNCTKGNLPQYAREAVTARAARRETSGLSPAPVDLGTEFISKFIVFDACQVDKRASLVWQLERLLPILADGDLVRCHTFPNLNHAAGALIALRQRLASIERD